jgi:hypothetical protein
VRERGRMDDGSLTKLDRELRDDPDESREDT